MAGSPWFDYATYMGNKLLQVQKSDSAGNWDMGKLVKAFADAGFVDAAGAEAHFMQFGQYEDVAPNPFFNATEYYRAKAVEFTGKKPAEITDLDVANVELAIKGLGMGAWSHYKAFGSNEKVNPSNAFDTEAYVAAKVAALNAVLADGKTPYEAKDVYAAMQAMGMSALEHFMTFGGDATKGEVPFKYDGTIPSAFEVPLEKQVKPAGSEGKSYALTTGIDNIVVDSLNGSVTYGVVSANANTTTLNLGDTITGNTGKDVLSILSDQAAIPGIQTTGVEVYSITNQAGTTKVNIHGSTTGLETLRLTGSANGTVTLSGAQSNLNFEMINDASKIDLSGGYIGTAPKEVSLTANGVKAGAEFKVETGTTTLNVAATGADSTFTQLFDQGSDLTTINVTGDKKLTVATAIEAAVTLVDASKQTAGGVDLSLSGAATKFLGGAGNDVVKLTSSTTQSQDIKGGSGDDTIVFNKAASAKYAANAPKISEFEVLRLDGVTNGSFAFDAITGLKALELMPGTLTGGLSVTNLGADTVVIAKKGFSGQDVTLGLKNSGGSTDTLALTLKSDDKTAVSFGDGSNGIVITGYEFLNLTSDGGLASNAENQLGLKTMGNLKKINVAGDSNVNILAIAKNVNIDAAAFEHNLKAAYAADLSAATTVKGGKGDDVVTLVDSTGIANLTFDGGEGKDTLVFTKAAALSIADAGLANITNVEALTFNSTGGTSLTAGMNFQNNFAKGVAVKVVEAGTTSAAVNINLSAAYTADANVDITTAATTANTEVTTGKGNDIVKIVASAITSGDITVNTGAGTDSIDVTVGSALSGTGAVSITGGKGADSIKLSGVAAADTALVTFDFAVGDSTVKDVDSITGYMGGTTSGSVAGMKLDFAGTVQVASALVNSTITVTNGKVVLDATMTLDQKLAFLGSAVADDKAVYFTEGNDVYVFAGNATEDSVVKLVGVADTIQGMQHTGSTDGYIFVA